MKQSRKWMSTTFKSGQILLKKKQNSGVQFNSKGEGAREKREKVRKRDH